MKRIRSRISCVGSPIGKSPIDGPIEKVVDDLKRILDIAHMVGTDKVRVFSFYPETDGLQAERVETSISRLRVLAEVAAERDVVLLLENEGGLVGDIPERCRALVEGVNSPHFRYVWDTGNYPQMGFERSVDIGWPLLAEYTDCVQVKDCSVSQTARLLSQVVAMGKSGNCSKIYWNVTTRISRVRATPPNRRSARRLQRRRGNEDGSRCAPQVDDGGRLPRGLSL